MTRSDLREEDFEELRRLQPSDWGDILAIHRFYQRSAFCKTTVVREGVRIVGIGTRVLFRGTAWLAHIIVDPERRSRGIGAFIVEGLLKGIDREAYPTISLIATDLGYPLYVKSGFRVVGEYGFFERKAEKSETPADPRIAPLPQCDQAHALELDRYATGEDRAELLKPALGEAIAYREGGAMTGLYIPALGEGSIVASSPEAGSALISFRGARADRATLPLGNDAGTELLRSLGFTESKRARKMVLGGDSLWRQESIFNRIGGNFG